MLHTAFAISHQGLECVVFYLDQRGLVTALTNRVIRLKSYGCKIYDSFKKIVLEEF